jgi:hypothetical protein
VIAKLFVYHDWHHNSNFKKHNSVTPDLLRPIWKLPLTDFRHSKKEDIGYSNCNCGDSKHLVYHASHQVTSDTRRKKHICYSKCNCISDCKNISLIMLCVITQIKNLQHQTFNNQYVNWPLLTSDTRRKKTLVIQNTVVVIVKEQRLIWKMEMKGSMKV